MSTMDNVSTFFILMALLLGVYIPLRCVIVFYMGRSRYTFNDYVESLRPMRVGPICFDGKGIETHALSRRVQHLREELAQAKVPAQPANFKRSLLVEAKRAQIAKLSFFQPARPEPEPHDDEHGFHLLLI